LGDRRHRSWSALDLVSFGSIPLVEVSGLAVAAWEQGTFLVAVGDHGPDLAYLELAAGDTDVTGWRVIDLSTISAPPGSPRVKQAEAVATDGIRQALVLIEDPPVLLVLDVPDRRLTHAFGLDGADLPGLGSTWATDPSSRGEGLVLLPGGHVLVVKEKKPAGFIEFGPQGDPPLGVAAQTLGQAAHGWTPPDEDTLTALAWWPASAELDDLSDAAVGPDGNLYLLSDKSNAVGRLRLPLAGDAPTEASFDQVWALPDWVTKAGGLAFLPDGRGVVAVDQPKVGRNLVTLPTLATWPGPTDA
jgi:hypothetical protein